MPFLVPISRASAQVRHSWQSALEEKICATGPILYLCVHTVLLRCPGLPRYSPSVLP